MAEQRLPIVGADDGTWGDILRQYLMKEHVNDDTDDPSNGGHRRITIQGGTATAGTAPLKFTSGTLLTAPEAGAMEFAGDNYYLTQTSGSTRKKIAIYDDSTGATGDLYYRDSTGYFTRLPAGNAGTLLTVNSGKPAWTASIVVSENNLQLTDNVDNTKKAEFNISSTQTTGTTRVHTLPTVDSVLVGRNTTDTLTNKTLDAPAVNGQITQSGNRPFINSNHTGSEGFAGGMTWQQSGTTRLEVFYDTASNTLNYWNTNGTNPGARMAYNREGYMYLGSGGGVDTNSRLKIYDNNSTATSGDVKGLMSEVYLDPSDTASTRAWGMHFIGATKAGNAQDLTGGDAIQGFEGKAQHNGTGTVTGANGGLLYVENSSTGTVTNARTLNLFPMANGNGGTVTNAYHLVTNGLPGFTENNQSRIAIDISASTPDPGSYTGTTAAAIRLNGGNGARDGILFANDVTLYRSAANTLKTDDNLIIGTPGTTNGSAVTIDGTQTLTNKSINAADNTITNLDVADFAASAIVTESDGIASNDNDNTIPTSAAVKNYIDSSGAGGGVVPYRDDIGTGSAGPYVVTHNLGTRDFVHVVRRNAGHVANDGSGEIVYVAVVPIDENSVSVEPAETWETDQMHIVIWPMVGDDVTAPDTPTLNQVSKTETSISVSATGSTAASYEWLIDGSLDARTTTTTHTYTGLTASTQYSCSVRALDLAGNATASAAVAITTDASAGDTQAPTAPTLTYVSKSTTTIDVSVSGATDDVGVTGYNFYLGGVKQNGSPVATTTYQYTGLTGDTAYALTATALDAASNESVTSNILNVTTDSSAAISFVAGVGEKTTTSLATMPTHQAGDMLIMFAYRDGFNTPPALPAGWTDITSGGGDSNAIRVGYKVAASSSEVSGTWTNTTNLVCLVYRNVASIGASALGAGTTDPVSVPSLSLQTTDGTSWVVAGGGHQSGADSLTTPPSGMTYRGGYDGNALQQDQGTWDTDGGVASWSGGTITYATTGGWRTVAVELKVT